MRQIRVRLTEPHTHAGTRHAPGTELTLPEHDALWLLDQRKAQPMRLRASMNPETQAAEPAAPEPTHG